MPLPAIISALRPPAFLRWAAFAPHARRVLRPRLFAAVLPVLFALAAGALRAQQPGSPAPGSPAPGAAARATTASASALTRGDTVAGGRVVTATTEDATREELTRALSRLEQRANDPAMAAAERARARSDAAAIGVRLTEGDIRSGDRFLLSLTLDSLVREEVTVRDGPTLEFGALAPLSLRGVLRAELAGAVQQHLRRFYRNPQVRVEPLIRISVVGGVGRPGPISVLPDLQLLDMLSQAGGISQTTETDKIIVRRAGKEIVNGKKFQAAAREGKTIAQLGLQSGDQVEVGMRNGASPWRNARIVFWGLSAGIAVLGLIRAFYQY